MRGFAGMAAGALFCALVVTGSRPAAADVLVDVSSTSQSMMVQPSARVIDLNPKAAKPVVEMTSVGGAAVIRVPREWAPKPGSAPKAVVEAPARDPVEVAAIKPAAPQAGTKRETRAPAKAKQVSAVRPARPGFYW